MVRKGAFAIIVEAIGDIYVSEGMTDITVSSDCEFGSAADSCAIDALVETQEIIRCPGRKLVVDLERLSPPIKHIDVYNQKAAGWHWPSRFTAATARSDGTVRLDMKMICGGRMPEPKLYLAETQDQITMAVRAMNVYGIKEKRLMYPM